MKVSPQKRRKFQATIYAHYKKAGRRLPWRTTRNPYHILVSEIMLQQTQVDRVLPKYHSFLKRFPNFQALHNASTKDVLTAWQGLGYNRRALALKKIAALVLKEHKGQLPRSPEVLETFPGIGPYTARAISTFAWNIPQVFLETNIRTVYIHFFFKKKKTVRDEEILELVEKTQDQKNPCVWYYALMDYGAMLKRAGMRYNAKSKSYRKQSSFKGSRRELRGKVLRILLKKKKLSEEELSRLLQTDSTTLASIIDQLLKEGVIKKNRTTISIGS